MPALAQDCCAQLACQEQAQAYAQRMIELLTPLGNSPADVAQRRQQVEALKRVNPAQYQAIAILFGELKSWAAAGPKRNLCLQEQITARASGPQLAGVLDWASHFVAEQPPIDPSSPEFCNVFAWQVEVNQGAVDAFRSSESYFLSAKTFVLAKTFGVKPGQCGGRTRLWLGGGLNYQDRDAMGLLAVRGEYRLKDLGAELATVGHLKYVVEPGFGFGPNTFQVLTGLGADLNLLQLQAMAGYQSRGNRYLLQLGAGYTFTKR